MPNSDPAWVRTVLVAVTVNNVPVVPVPDNEVAAGGLGAYTGVDTTYQMLVSWTVSAVKVGKLDEISMTADNYAKSLWQLSIAGINYFVDKSIRTALDFEFADLSLAAGSSVILSVKSSDGTAITANGIITGKEVG